MNDVIQSSVADIMMAAPAYEAIVNPVNCVGVMGSGLAREIKFAYPDNFIAYLGACTRREVWPGKMFVFDRETAMKPKFIINFPTKQHWRQSSRLEDIEAGLISLAQEIESREITSIAIPALGCGLGGLDWADVKPRILAALRPFKNLHTLLCEPQ